CGARTPACRVDTRVDGWRILAILLLAIGTASAQPGQPAPARPSRMRDASAPAAKLPTALEGVGIDQKLDAQVPLGLTFRDEFGHAQPLSTYFHGKPVLLALVYYRCPMLCMQILRSEE